jgi:uncharacterized paraquat-inducible protein A
MTELKKTILTATAVILGGVLYLGLNWIPVIGPLAVGFFVGQTIKETPWKSFRAGIHSAILGVLLLAIVLARTGILDPEQVGLLTAMFVAWILLIWNLIGVFLTGLGAMLGSLAHHAKKMIDHITTPRIMPINISLGMPSPRKVIRLEAPPEERGQKQNTPEKRIKFNICPSCGMSNQQSRKTCETCGKRLKHKDE